MPGIQGLGKQTDTQKFLKTGEVDREYKPLVSLPSLIGETKLRARVSHKSLLDLGVTACDPAIQVQPLLSVNQFKKPN